MTETSWLTPAEVAEQLSCSPRHVRRLVADGLLEALDLRRPGSTRARWRIRADSVSEVLSLRTIHDGLHGPTAQGGTVRWDLAVEDHHE